MILKISGIPGSMTSRQFTQLLQPFAVIYSAQIIVDPVTQKSKRFALVEVSLIDAKRLIEVFDGKSIATGQILKVQERRHKMKNV